MRNVSNHTLAIIGNVTFHRIALLAAAAVCFSACSKKPDQNKEAVERGVIEYLQNRSGLDVKAMDVRVANVSFRENEAEATVSFSAKGASDASNMMQMRYVLESKDGKWVVKGRSGGQGGHGGGAAGGPPGSGGHGGEAPSELPPGHPPAGGNKP